MPSYYIVKEGDFLSSIAKDNGFTDYKTIWNDPNNTSLKQKRQNPNILFPGDRLFIPDLKPRVESCSTDQQHCFKVAQPELKLRLVLEDLYEKPIANAKCDLVVEGNTFPMATDGKGKLEQPIPPDAHTAVLIIHDPQTPFQDTAFTLKIGNLDPIDEVSGQKARLNNLGYFAGDVNGDEADNDAQEDGEEDDDEQDDDAFKSAVEEFQCDHGLSVDGVCGPKTQAKLKEAACSMNWAN